MWLASKLRRRPFTPAPTNHYVLIWSHVTCYIKGKIIAFHTRYERWRRSVDIRAGKWQFFSLQLVFWIPTVTSRRLDFRPCKQAEFSLCLSQHAVFLKRRSWGVRPCSTTCFDECGVSKRLQLLIVFKQSLKWIWRSWDNFTARSKVDLCSFLVSFDTLSFSFFQKGHKSCRGINKFCIGLSLLLHAFLVWI